MLQYTILHYIALYYIILYYIVSPTVATSPKQAVRRSMEQFLWSNSSWPSFGTRYSMCPGIFEHIPGYSKAFNHIAILSCCIANLQTSVDVLKCMPYMSRWRSISMQPEGLVSTTSKPNKQ